MQPFKKIYSFLLLFCSLTVSGLLLSIFLEKQWLPASFSLFQKESFQSFSSYFLEDQLSNDPLSTHFLWLDPPFSIKKEAALPLYQATFDSHHFCKLEKRLQKSSAPKNSIASLEKEKLLSFFSLQYALSAYPYYEEPLSPNGGLQIELPILLNGYLLESKEDISTYLSLLSSFPAWADSLLTYEKQKKEAGLFMSYTLVEETIDQCSALSSDETLFTDSFLSKLNPLLEEHVITQKQYLTFLETQKELLCEKVLPSYERLAKELSSLADPTICTQGLSAFPEGKDYYEALLASLCGSLKSPKEMEAILYSRYEVSTRAYQKALSSFLARIADYPDYCFSFPLTNEKEMLSYLKAKTMAHFPELPVSNPPEELIFPVPQGLLPYTAPAFYLVSPMDHPQTQQIFINYQQTQDALSLFTTLAHEGYPGHLYQHIYSTELAKQEGAPLVNALFSNPGYQEGWAIYAELWGYDLAKYLASSPIDQAYIETVKWDHVRQLTLLAYLDICIHYEGYGYEKASVFLQTLGITDAANLQSIYTYLVSVPGNYVQYMMGYLELLDCQKMAMEKWGSSYSQERFVSFFLGIGSAPYSFIKKQLISSP